MTRKIVIAGAGILAAAAIAGGAIAAASSDGEGGVTGPEADRATRAALEATGGGRANAVERDNENGAIWEVEVTRPDGRTVDVRLDENYDVVVIEGDAESPDDDDSTD